MRFTLFFLPNRSRAGARQRLGSERGAAALELAFVLPILVLLIFGMVQFSIAYNRTQALHAAAREGARVGSLPQTSTSEITDRVNDALTGINFDTTPTISISPSGGQPCNRNGGGSVVVSVKAPHTISIPLWGDVDVDLTGRGDFRCEVGS